MIGYPRRVAVQDIPRERWLAHLGRVVAIAEARKGRLDEGELTSIARELGIGEADLAAAAQEAADHFARGQGFSARALWSDAIAELSEAHTLAPARLDISLALARAHQRRGRGDDRAIADRLARMALEWEPGNEAAFAILADLDAARRARKLRLRWLALGGGVLVAALALRSGVLAAALGVIAFLLFRTGGRNPGEPATQGALPANNARAPAQPRALADPPAAPTPAPKDGECPDGTAPVDGRGCVAEDVVITPGVGLAGLQLGTSTPQDVLAAFGDDCQINRYSSGEIWQLNYDYDEHEEYEPSRRRNRSRPHQFGFKREVLREISVGVYNRQLRTPGGLKAESSTLDDALREFGDHYEFEAMTRLDSYRWPAHGIEVWVSRDTGTINSFKIVAIER